MLAHFGLLDRLMSEGGGEAVEAFNFVRYTDGKFITSMPGAPWMRKHYGYAWRSVTLLPNSETMVGADSPSAVHRADYLRVLVDEAWRLGVEIRLGCQVTKIQSSAPYVDLANGERVQADVIIGADGMSIAPRTQSRC